MPISQLNEYKYLNIGYGFGNNIGHMSIPISIELSEEMPCTSLEVHLMIEDPNQPDLVLTAYESKGDGGWEGHTYSITEGDQGAIYTLLTPVGTIEDAVSSSWIAFYETVETKPCKVEDLFIIS